MPAQSKSQQRLMGMVYQYKETGKLPDNDDLADKIKKIAQSISKQDAKDFAMTKHKGKPELVESMLTFKQYLTEIEYKPEKVKELAKGALAQLAKIGKDGKLPSVYKNVQDFLYDFYPDLPWEAVAQIKAMKLILSDPTFKTVAAEWKEKLDFDWDKELREAIKEIQKEIHG